MVVTGAAEVSLDVPSLAIVPRERTDPTRTQTDDRTTDGSAAASLQTANPHHQAVDKTLELLTETDSSNDDDRLYLSLDAAIDELLGADNDK